MTKCCSAIQFFFLGAPRNDLHVKAKLLNRARWKMVTSVALTAIAAVAASFAIQPILFWGCAIVASLSCISALYQAALAVKHAYQMAPFS